MGWQRLGREEGRVWCEVTEEAGGLLTPRIFFPKGLGQALGFQVKPGSAKVFYKGPDCKVIFGFVGYMVSVACLVIFG